MQYYFIIADEDDGVITFKDVVKEGTFDNGYGYILSWYILSSKPDEHPRILATTIFNEIPRFVVYVEELYTFSTYEIIPEDLHSSDDILIVIDTSKPYTNNPYGISNEKIVIERPYNAKYHSESEDEKIGNL